MSQNNTFQVKVESQGHLVLLYISNSKSLLFPPQNFPNFLRFKFPPNQECRFVAFGIRDFANFKYLIICQVIIFRTTYNHNMIMFTCCIKFKPIRFSCSSPSPADHFFTNITFTEVCHLISFAIPQITILQYQCLSRSSLINPQISKLSKYSMNSINL